MILCDKIKLLLNLTFPEIYLHDVVCFNKSWLFWNKIFVCLWHLLVSTQYFLPIQVFHKCVQNVALTPTS